jgi:hypothetical protein
VLARIRANNHQWPQVEVCTVSLCLQQRTIFGQLSGRVHDDALRRNGVACRPRILYVDSDAGKHAITKLLELLRSGFELIKQSRLAKYPVWRVNDKNEKKKENEKKKKEREANHTVRRRCRRRRYRRYRRRRRRRRRHARRA